MFKSGRRIALAAGALTSAAAAFILIGNEYQFQQQHQRRSPLRQLQSESKQQSSSSASTPTQIDDNKKTTGKQSERLSSLWVPPTRTEMLNLLQGNSKDGSALASEDQEFDLLVIGGGATGVGVAVDAASRGLKVALVERDDFSSGTSSRSTKLVHGGVRYLEKAVFNLDIEQYKLVQEALAERHTVLRVAPYLAQALPIMCPIYKWWQVPYYYAGCKAYDLVAGKRGLESSYFLTKTRAQQEFPMIRTDNLVGAMVYYDGQQNDSRMNVVLGLTAAYYGAALANHVEVLSLLKSDREGKQKLSGAVVRDTLTGKEWTIKAKGIVNATGPFTDFIRKMDEPESKEIIAPSAGTHIVLPHYFSPEHMGLIDPSTSDGRVIFFLPWEGNTVAGTTDSPTKVTYDPVPTEEEIRFILNEVSHYLDPDIKVRRGDVLAAWSGIRPLVRNPNAKDTAGLVRNHLIHVSESGLLTVAGGKWTTYRKMAEEAVDEAIHQFGLHPKTPCLTENLLLIGSHGYNPRSYIRLIQHFGMETEVAEHLIHNYGDRAFAVAALASNTGQRWPLMGRRLAYPYLYIEAEVRYACQREYACTAVDVIARRTRLAFLNAQAALEALPRVIDIMTEELKWDEKRKQEEYQQALKYLQTMGLDTNRSRANFKSEQILYYRNDFQALDYDKDGVISTADLKEFFRQRNYPAVKEDELKHMISEVDLNKNGVVDFNEFLEFVMAATDEQDRNGFYQIVSDVQQLLNHPISTERSGGGV